MSNKANTHTMKNEGKTALTPKLRFPEFRGKDGWDSIPMGSVYSFKNNNPLSRDQLNYENGTIKNIHYGDIHTKFSTLFDITKEMVPFITPSDSLDRFRPEHDCVEGDIIFADASEDMEDIGKSIEIICLNGERLVAGQHTILARPNRDVLVVGFGAYLFKSRRVRIQIQKESQGAKVLGLSAVRLTKISLSIPRNKAEQQKIAACLASLDELIGFEKERLEALKTSKKGLMQQLYPREGKREPRLRFPEFRGSGEWEEKRLGNEIELISGMHLLPDQYGITGDVPYFSGPSDFTDDFQKISKWTKRSVNMAERNDTLITVKGSGVGEVWYLMLPEIAMGRQLMSVRAKHGSSQFIFQLFLMKSARFEDLGSGNLIPGLSRADILEMEAPFPNLAEQQRIAACLSSLDDLISAQSDKLEALKAHKQGLMQQLFPSMSAAEA